MEEYTPETVNVPLPSGLMPLELECRRGTRNKHVPALIKMGADVNHPGLHHHRIFAGLCRGGHPDIIRVLLNAGMKVNQSTRTIPSYVAYVARAYRIHQPEYRRAWKEIIVILLGQGCDPTLKFRGLTALDYMCMHPTPYRLPTPGKAYRVHFHLEMVDLIYQAGQTGLSSHEAVMRHIGADKSPFPVDHTNASVIYSSASRGLILYRRRIGQCGAATVTILGLIRVKSRSAKGNNRDVLGIIGGMVWSSRCETEWDVNEDGMKRAKK